MSGSNSPTFFHGQPWSSWIEKIGRDKPLSDEEPETDPPSSVTRLSAEDIDLYGFCPERDAFYGVVCETCNAIVKPQALIQHMEIRHSSGTVNLPPPATPAVKPLLKTPYCKVPKLKKTPTTSQVPSTSKTIYSSNKRTADQANLHSLLPLPAPRSPLETVPVQAAATSSSSSTSSSAPVLLVTTSPVKSPGPGGQPRRKRLKTDRSLLKDREYDPDRHCGVWNDETGKPCTRSLTCKAHTVSLRRTVSGRSKTFDKLLAEHRAAKELPGRPAKVTVSGTITVSSMVSQGAVVSTAEVVAPASPPVLSLPDTYPLPKAVDLLYRCLAPHGSAKPTKLEEDFVNEELALESSLASSTTVTASITTPISVVLPSLSPLPVNTTGSPIATLIPATTTAVPFVTTSPIGPTAQPAVLNSVLEVEAPIEVDPEGLTIYSPVSIYKDGKSQIIVQIPQSKSAPVKSPVLKNYQAQASMPSLSIFDSAVSVPQISQMQNGKRIGSHSHTGIGRPSKRSKHDFQREFSTAIQVEATTTSSPYPHFSDISWSNCHPEPLAVSRWLRITSSRKQYNFNIH